MKLNYDCLNDTMLLLQEKLDYFQSLGYRDIVSDPLLEKYSENEIGYALVKINEMELVYAKTSAVLNKWEIMDITMAGHAFLKDLGK